MKAWTPPYSQPRRTYHLAAPHTPTAPLCRTWEAMHAPGHVYVLETERVTCPSCLRALTDLEVTE